MKMMATIIKIGGKKYEVLDALNNITLADSFVKNKIGTGHGEAKLYVGNENDRFREFFDDLTRQCFFLKNDFNKFLLDAKDEFYSLCASEHLQLLSFQLADTLRYH